LRGFSKTTRRRLGRVTALCLVLLSLISCSGRGNLFSESRDERLRRLDDERSRLARAGGPVDRTRVQIRISNLLVSLMSDAVTDGDIERMEERMNEYRLAVTDARDTMMGSGRDAADNSSGFQDLEIALRQHVRQLGDIGSQLTFQFRQPFTELIDDVADIRRELLGALFPGPDGA
jgi:hypothetical protein